MAPIEQNEPGIGLRHARHRARARAGRCRGHPAGAHDPSSASRRARVSPRRFAARRARRYGGVAGLSGGLIGPEGTPANTQARARRHAGVPRLQRRGRGTSRPRASRRPPDALRRLTPRSRCRPHPGDGASPSTRTRSRRCGGSSPPRRRPVARRERVMSTVPLRSDAACVARPRRRHGRARGLHPPDPARGRARDHPPAPPRPDARADDARTSIYDQMIGMGCAAQARSSRGAATRASARCTASRDAVERGWPRAARDRGAQPRRHGRPRTRPAPSGLPFARAARLRRHRPARHTPTSSGWSPARSPASALAAVPALRPDVDDRPRPAGRPRAATCSCGASSACRRRRVLAARRARSSPSRRSSTI